MSDSAYGRVTECPCAFPKNGTATGNRRECLSNGGLRRDKRAYISTTKVSFRHQLFTFRSVLHSDHGGVVRISVANPKYSILLYCLFTQHNFSPTRSVIINKHRAKWRYRSVPLIRPLRKYAPSPPFLPSSCTGSLTHYDAPW